jgi:hypothetical protein
VSALKIEYSDSAFGAEVDLQTGATGDLSENLVDGKTYLLKARIRVSSGSVNLIVDQTGDVSTAVSNATYETKEIIFICDAYTSIRLRFSGQEAGEDIYFDWYTVQEWTNGTAYNAPTFTALEGFTGSGTTAYIDCNWNPNVNGVNYLQDDCSVGHYSRTDVNEPKTDWGVTDGTNQVMINTRNGGNTYIRLNCISSSAVASTDSSGMFVSIRHSSLWQDVYRNGTIHVDGVSTSTSIPNYNMYVLGRNNAGSLDTATSRQLSCFFAGGALTSGEITIVTNAIEAYMDSNGKGVIA